MQNHANKAKLKITSSVMIFKTKTVVIGPSATKHKAKCCVHVVFGNLGKHEHLLKSDF